MNIKPADLALHGLRIKGMAAAPVLTALTGLEHTDLSEALSVLERRGDVDFLEKRSVWRITKNGRESHADIVVNLLDADASTVFRTAYHDRFLPVNADFKACCADWQVRDGQPNDHEDEEYDRGILDRLDEVHFRIEPILEVMAPATAHLARYTGRLTAARSAVFSGDRRRFTGFGCDSYHDVWMELHEDLIQLLRIDRAEEGSA